jgi:hypothetical protein
MSQKLGDENPHREAQPIQMHFFIHTVLSIMTFEGVSALSSCCKHTLKPSIALPASPMDLRPVVEALAMPSDIQVTSFYQAQILIPDIPIAQRLTL